MDWIQETPNGIDVHVPATPRVSKNGIQGLHDGALKVRLTTTPVDGNANQALLKFMSKTLHISNAQIELKQGETSRRKIIHITGMNKNQFLERLKL